MTTDDERRGRPASERRGGARPGYHDPTAGIGGAAPARSALTLRMALAVFGLVICLAAAIAFIVVDASPGWVVVAGVGVVIAVVDMLVISRRKRRGEPG